MSSIGGEERTIEIVLVEPRALLRDAIAGLIERRPPFRVSAKVERVRDLATLGRDPRILLMALDLPDGRGPAAVSTASRYASGASILVLSGVRHPSIVEQSIAAGATGYLLTSSPAAQLYAALEAVARKESFLDPALEEDMTRWHGPSSVAPATALRHLSTKEIDVLRWLALGHTNAEIASLSGVSLRTVETHRARVFRKLGLRTRAELVRYAFDEGLVETQLS